MKSQNSNFTCVDPFPRLIWKLNYDFNFPSIKDELLKIASETKLTSKLEQGQSFSSVSNQTYPPHEWPIFQDFGRWIGPHIKEINAYFGYLDHDYTISNSWYNVHYETGITTEHCHNRADLVLACYLNVPTNSGNIEFRDPLEYHKCDTPIHPEEHLWKEVQIKTNDVLIFPGWLKHRTQENSTNEPRVVMSMNVSS